MGHKLRHNADPVLRWMADCTSIAQDSNGNIKPVKPERKKSSKRIDGIVAIINGLARMIVQTNLKSTYEDHDLEFIG